MPHRYEGHRLPSVLYANIFDYVVGVVCILAGVRVALEPSALPASILDLDDILTVSYRVILLLSGVFILYGLASKYKSSWGSSFERSGMWLAGTAFLIYGAALLAAGAKSGAFLIIAILLCVALGCWVRAMGLAIESRWILNTLKDAPRKYDP